MGLPLVGATHQVAQSLVPESRVVYVDNDPMVLSHARALMKSAPGGAVGYVDADMRDSAAIVAGARETLDLGPADGGLAAVHARLRAGRRGGGRGGVVTGGGHAAGQLCRDLPPGQRPGPGAAWKRAGSGTS